jgi:hypothetical protein
MTAIMGLNIATIAQVFQNSAPTSNNYRRILLNLKRRCL